MFISAHAYKVLGLIHHTIVSTHSTSTMVTLCLNGLISSTLLHPSMASTSDE